MSVLVVLLKYGAVISWGLVASLTWLWLRGVRSVRTWDLEQLVEAERAQRGSRDHRLREGNATLRGTLRGTGDDRWVECAGIRVQLVGETKIEHGARLRRTTMPALRDGDLVFATGQLQHAARSDEALGYRTNSAAWLMTPGEQTAIELFAVAPCVRAPRPGPVAIILCAALSYGALFLAGRVANHALDQVRNPNTMFVAGSLASMLPGLHDEALERVLVGLNRRRNNEMRALRLEVASANGCRAGGRALLAEGELERALAVAHACGDATTEVRALLSLGRHDDAATRAMWGGAAAEVAVTAYISAGRWKQAAIVIDDVIARLLRAPEAYAFAGYYYEAQKSRLPCLARRFHAFADASAGARRAGDDGCGSMQRDAQEIIETMLTRAERDERDEPWSSLLQLRAERIWAAPFLPVDTTAPRWQSWMALYAAYRGDLASARAHIAAVRSRAPDPELELAVQVLLGAPVVESDGLAPYDRTLDFAPYELRRWPEKLHAQAVVYRALAPAKLGLERDDWFTAAVEGDGYPLTRRLHESAQFVDAADVLATLPYVTQHRDELRASLAHSHLEGDHWRARWLDRDNDTSLLTEVNRAVLKSKLLRGSGNTELADRWARIIERHAAMLAHRERLVGLRLFDAVGLNELAAL